MRTEAINGLTCLVLESESLVCKFLPELGDKMITLTDKRSGREWVKPERQVTYRMIGYEGNYGDFDRTGFDECFPAIASAPYPYEPWKGAVIPDHGEVWSIPWHWEKTGGGIRMWVHGVRFPYVFEKRIAIEEDALLIAYMVENPSCVDLPCFWSAHPIFNIQECMRVLVPGHSKVVIDYSKNDRLGRYLDEVNWPEAVDSSGNKLDLSVFGSKSNGTADKIFFCHVEDGYAALYESEIGDYLGFMFDMDKTPHIGLWSNVGGWPFEGEPDYNCALEPCSGYPDRLGMGKHQVVPAYGELCWTLRLELGQFKSETLLTDYLRAT